MNLIRGSEQVRTGGRGRRTQFAGRLPFADLLVQPGLQPRITPTPVTSVAIHHVVVVVVVLLLLSSRERGDS